MATTDPQTDPVLEWKRRVGHSRHGRQAGIQDGPQPPERAVNGQGHPPDAGASTSSAPTPQGVAAGGGRSGSGQSQGAATQPDANSGRAAPTTAIEPMPTVQVGVKSDPAASKAVQRFLHDKLKDVRIFVRDRVCDHFDVYAQYVAAFAAGYQKRQREQAKHDKAEAELLDATLLALAFFFAPEIAEAGATAALTAILTKVGAEEATAIVSGMKDKLAAAGATLVVKQLSENLKKSIGDKLSDSHMIFDKLIDYCNTVSDAMTANRNAFVNMSDRADAAQLVLVYSAILTMPKQKFRSEMEHHLAKLEKRLSGKSFKQDQTPQVVNQFPPVGRVDTAPHGGG